MNHKGKFIVLAACIVLTITLFMGCVTPAQEHLNKGNAYSDQGEFDEAIEEFTEATRLQPRVAVYQRNLGVAYVQAGETQKARMSFQRVLELERDGPSAEYARRMLEELKQ